MRVAVTDQPSTSFDVVEASFGAVSGLAVRGELDVAAVPRLEEALEAAITRTTGGFVVDLSDVAFLDSSGLLALLHGRGLLAREGRALVVVCPPGPVRQVFEVAGVAQLLILCASAEDVEAAIASAR
jgi:anti-sigma B factor antagonist